MLVDEYVRTGKVRIVFRGLAFLGPDSVRALRVTLAAGRQNRLWDVLEGLYYRQGAENSGWVTEAMLHEVAGHRAIAGSGAPWVDRELTKSAQAAQAAGVAGTPAFQIGRTGRLSRARPGQLARARGTATGDRVRARQVSDHRLRLASAFLALAGAAVSGYLLWVRETGANLICATGGCETVQSSQYSEILGMPVALLGLACYVALFATALLRSENARLLHTALALTGVVFSTYLLYVQIELIGAVCQWCLASDGIVSGLAVLALLRMRVAQRVLPA